ncbi:hypothetical protein BC937DRAFT_89036 [Endogone sp. FLAS-F59071]|nr:hypothetical protein BC937DRAFT_89036 [Endogone sp. FLAS-F59071]|eukprot:RUS18209.1 hypothetical protein BC937DRAFT_89036 [Endogone sp. FLAS-F59071]
MATFRCKFDENMLGVAKKLITDSVIRARFKEPEAFADDVEIEGIRGADDVKITTEATKARRMIITNDTDFFVISPNAFGTLVLRGGVQGDNNVTYGFHRLPKGEKESVISRLFTQYMGEMQRVQNGPYNELATLEGTCRILTRGKKIEKQFNDDVRWNFRKPAEDEIDKFTISREEKLMRQHKVAEKANFALIGEQLVVTQANAVEDPLQLSEQVNPALPGLREEQLANAHVAQTTAVGYPLQPTEQVNPAFAGLKEEQPVNNHASAVGDSLQQSQLLLVANQPDPRQVHVCDISNAPCLICGLVAQTNSVCSSRSTTPEGLRIEQAV